MEKITKKQNKPAADDLLRLTIEEAPIGILTFSEQWKIEYLNQNFIKIGALYNIDLSDVYGNNILKTGLLPDISFTTEFLELKNGIPFERELRNIKTADRGNISLFIKAVPLFNEGIFSGGIVILEDLGISHATVDEIKLKSEAFENLFSRLDDLLFISDRKGEVLFSYGKKIKRLYPDLHSTHFFLTDIIDPAQLSEFNLKLQTVINKRTSMEMIIESSSAGNPLFYECRFEPFINKQGQVQFVFFLMRDITKSVLEKRNLEEEVDSLKLYREIAGSVNDALFAVDWEGKVIFWNDASEKLFGISREEINDKFFGSALEIFDEEYFNKIKEELYQKNFWKINLNIFKKDGSKETVEAKFTLSNDENNSIIVLCSDITEQTEAWENLRESENKFRSIISETIELICNLDPDGTINFANKVFLDSLRYSEDEIFGRNIIDFIDREYLRLNVFDLKGFEKGSSKNIELPLLTKKGYQLFVSAKFVPVYSEKKNLKSYNAYFTDVTQKKSSEKDLMIIQSLFESSQDGIAVECEGKIIIANESFAQIFGYEKIEELVSVEFLDLIANTDTFLVAEYLKIVEKKKKMPGRLECLGKRSDGSNFFIEVSVAAFESENKIYKVLVTRDITERKRAQQVIRESEEKYKSITENIDDFLFTFERIGKFFKPTFYTSSVEKITGYTQTDFLSDYKLILKIVHPDDFPLVKKRLKTILKSRIQLAEEFEFKIINKQGNVVWVRNKINFNRSSDGRVQKIYGLVSDITLRKRAEEELSRSTENLVKLNETKDKFISIISHDLRTPFTSILGFTDLLLNDEGLDENEKRQYITFIRESSQSMLALVNSLLDWTRLQTGRIKFEPERVDIRETIENSINALSGTAFQKAIQLNHYIKDELFVFIDKNLILQVFNNLISNAIKFTHTGGQIDIYANPSTSIRFMEFTVKDNGTGIKPENLKNLFRIDTKFTSEGTAGEKGSGLGLSLVKEIIEKHGGRIWVESVYGSGTEFKFLLPIASANILLVDDNKTDRLLYTKILKSITGDYNIDIASNGKEALEKIMESSPALLITDHAMPEMNGYELILALKKADLKQKPPVIVLSSGLDRNIIADYTDIGIEYVFNKPVNLSSFKLAVEKSLKKGIR